MRGTNIGIIPPFLKRFAGQHTAVSVTGTTDETELFAVTIPGGTLGPNGILRVWALWTLTNNANAKNTRMRFGGTSFKSSGAANRLTFTHFLTLFNRNTENSQVTTNVISLGWGDTSSDPIVTGSIDTTINQVLQITAQLANAGDTAVLEAVFVEIIKP